MIQTRNIIFNEKTVFDDDIEAASLELKKIQTAQNMSFDQLVKLLQQLNEMKTTRQFKSDRLNLDDNDIVMSESDNIDSDNHNHNSDENQLWNEESLKNYTLNVLNMLKFSYFTFSEILSVLLIIIIYWISDEHDEDSHNMNFKSWKTVFTAERLVQFEKIQ